MHCQHEPGITAAKRVDFLTRYCGVSLPTLFKRIGIMAVDGHPLPTRFDAARLRRVSRPELAWHTGNPSLGPYVQAGLPVKDTTSIIASGPAHAPSQARLDNRRRMVVAKPSSWPIAIYRPRRNERTRWSLQLNWT
jgi:hypothetical protein